jgi:DNA-binding response OmpR family regulator
VTGCAAMARARTCIFTKPVDSEELALAIGNLARRMRDLMPQTVLETDMRSTAHGILRLERTRRMLHGPNGTSVSLSGREVALLEYLAAHPYLTISREEIAHVFGDADAHPESRALDAAISRMRIKLRAEGMDMPFHTIKGAGLRMTEAIAVE